MAKSQTKLIINTDNIREDNVFPTLTALFKAVANKPLSSGRTKENQLAQLSRYLEYRKLCEVDPSCTKKNSVIVTKIHNPPLAKEYDGRGRHGTYMDLVKPLLLKMPKFQGKYTTLANQIGLFAEYFEKVKASNSGLAQQLNIQWNEWDYDLWQQRDSMPYGEKAYCNIISGKLKEVLKDSLESLHKEKIILMVDLYMIIPDKVVIMEDYNTRIRSKAETITGWKECQKAIRQEAECKNSTLDAELAEHLIFGFDHEHTFILPEGIDENIPIACSIEQMSAIENYQLYVRQCAAKEYLHLDELPRKESHNLITNAGLFFQNPRLFRIYKRIDKALRIRLFGDVKFWKEVWYEIEDTERAKRYLASDEFDAVKAAYLLSQKVLDYMDRQMHHEKVEADEEWLDDIKRLEQPKASKKYNLRCYKSAVRFHKMLKGLYDMDAKRTVKASNDTDISKSQKLNAVSG